MYILYLLLEISLQIFTSWTLAYHLALLTRLPAKLIFIPFLIILCLLITLFGPKWKYKPSQLKSEKWFLLRAGGLALVTGSFTLLNSRPDIDDFNFFHRPLTQLQHLVSPFILTDTSYNISGLPALSLLHLMTSYEPLTALVAALFGVDPLTIYQNVSAFLSGIILTITYILLYRQFRLNPRYVIVATLSAFLFLLLDGNLHRSFGNISLVRLWQGKAILWTVLIPLTLLMAHRFLSRPTARRFSLVAMTGICAVGLSGSGVFLIPCLILGISLAYLLSYGVSRMRLSRAILLNFASFYCVAIAASLVLGLLPEPTDSSVWSEGWPLTWWQNLGLVVDNNATLTRDLLILLILPLIGLVKPVQRFPIALTVSLCLIFANPLTGPFWMDKVKPGSYWRLAYLFPLPWCAGLIGSSLIRQGLSYKAYLPRIALVTIVILSIIYAYQFSVLNPPPEQAPIYFKLPWEYKFAPLEFSFARSISGYLQNKNVLAPQSIVTILGLINPSVKFEATRPSETLHLFRNIGQEREGLRRVTAQNFVTNCEYLPEEKVAFLHSLEMGVNAVVIRDCETGLFSTLADLAKEVPSQWHRVEQNNGYILFLRQ